MESNKSNINDGTTFDVVYGFDMETDVGSFTPYYEGVQHGTPEILKICRVDTNTIKPPFLEFNR